MLAIKILKRIILERVSEIEELLTRKIKKISIDKNKDGEDSLSKDIFEIEYFNYGELDYYAKKYSNSSKKKLKKG